MNINIAIQVTKLSKRYSIGKEKDGSLRGHLTSIFKSSKKQTNEFWALQDVSFEIQKGDVIGVIGKNGAGKSTLLKILSQITKPTTGRVEINGRIASLLEVGTGFHPELTGRENIYLNGTILGMTRKEVKNKFDEIVEFSGVEKFIDTPVKNYSSGMYVRLAFAVAAHLEPEILIIDEVLAVGDAEFQKKCLGKMKEVAGQGRTVLFVSHNIAAVKNLCNRSILLNSGKLVAYDKTETILEKYLQSDNFSGSTWNSDHDEFKPIYLHMVRVEVDEKKPKTTISVEILFKINEKFPTAFVAFYISDKFGSPLFEAIPIYEPFIEFTEVKDKTIHFEIELPNMIPGKYQMGVWLGNDHQYTLDWQKEIISFEINKNPLPERTVEFPEHAGSIYLPSKLIRP